MNNQAFPRPDVLRRLENLAQPHVESFDYFLGDGMEKVLECLEGVEVRSEQIEFWLGKYPLVYVS